jgi:AcrR family transcriptional regulator
MPPRKRLELEERRAQLLELAKSAFSARSFDEVSIDELAQAAGVSKGLLYHYFPSKRDLYVATIRVAADELMQRTLPNPSLPPRDQVFVGVSSYLGYVEEHEASFLTLLQGGIGRDREVYAIIDDVRRAFVDVTLSRMGALNTPVQRTLVRGWVGMVEAASLEWAVRKSVTRDELTKLLVKNLLYTLQLGLRARGG